MEYWITKPTKIANKISSSCVVCIGMRAKNMQQKMAILDPVRTQPSPPFTHTAMDLAGPFLVVDAVKKRVTKKIWVCVAVWRYMYAVNLEMVEDYSISAFLQALQIFTNRRGTPTTILSDRGTQIVATSKATVDYFDMEKLMERVGEEKKISWEFAPGGSPHVNGQAERAIKPMKKYMAGVAQRKHLSYGEFASQP
ncbi:MAG: transposase family protein [Gammaproteobacteria bacterium]|nr:transposase family protein [Gammaproteobacteria bacterium]